jgi:hypothetical protein
MKRPGDKPDDRASQAEERRRLFEESRGLSARPGLRIDEDAAEREEEEEEEERTETPEEPKEDA